MQTNADLERNWKGAIDYLKAYLYLPGGRIDHDAVAALKGMPTDEAIEGFNALSMHLLLQLVNERTGVVDNVERIRLARQTLDDLRDNRPGLD